MSDDTHHSKVVLVGAAFTGKTSILNRYMKNAFISNLPPSTQPACMKKSIKTKSCTVELEIWDTAGQERYHSLSPLFYRDSQFGIIVYDITEADTFNAAKQWARELIDARGNEISLIVAANKLDLSEQRAVSFSQLAEFAESMGADFFEISAKTGENISMLFNCIAEKTKGRANLAKDVASPSEIQESGCSC